jgi:hypothetical protein
MAGAPLVTRDLTAPQQKALRSMERAGMVHLADYRPQGVERFFENGRLERTPARFDDLRRVLEHLAHQVLGPGEEVTERVLMERLAPLAHDPVGRRREMVELGFVERTRDGSLYWLPVGLSEPDV